MDAVDFGNNVFCGPSVLSAIAGINTDEAAAVISSITGQRVVKAVYLKDLMQAFRQLGYKTIEESWVGSSVFSALHSLHGRDGQYVFMVPGHFIAIESNGNHKYICDNHTKSPINVSSSARLGMKVTALFRVEKIVEVPKPKPIIEELAIPAPHPESVRSSAVLSIEVKPEYYVIKLNGHSIGHWSRFENMITAVREELSKFRATEEE